MRHFKDDNEQYNTALHTKNNTSSHTAHACLKLTTHMH